MKVIFAQGNPGLKYNTTRHNVGAAIIGGYGVSHGATWKEMDKFQARIAELTIADEKVLLVFPQTYYNETGSSARRIVDFYKLNPAEDLLVIHDDLALPLGTIRTRAKGSDAGNNGIKSLNAHLGDNYHRLRVGIWTERHPDMTDVDFVLGNFSKDEEALIIENLLPIAFEAIDHFIQGKLSITSHRT